MRDEIRKALISPPEVRELFLEAPLYSSFNLNMPTPSVGVIAVMESVERKQLALMGRPPAPWRSVERMNQDAICGFSGPLDAHCTNCGRESVFRVAAKDTFDCRRFACSRNPEHILVFYLRFYSVRLRFRRETLTQEELSALPFEGDQVVAYEYPAVEKIGQHPSVAELAESVLGQFANVLGNDDQRELKRAIGLAAHGIGVGSFVYLRRIFERLLETAHSEARKAPEWDEDKYASMRVEGRILALAACLPPFLVAHRGMYGVLSKGLHELSEAECLAAFPVVRGGIELILQQALARKGREAAEEKLGASIADLSGKLKTKGRPKASPD